MNGSPLAEDCDNYLGQIGDLNEDDLAMSTDRILEELNRRARQRCQHRGSHRKILNRSGTDRYQGTRNRRSP